MGVKDVKVPEMNTSPVIFNPPTIDEAPTTFNPPVEVNEEAVTAPVDRSPMVDVPVTDSPLEDEIEDAVTAPAKDMSPAEA